MQTPAVALPSLRRFAAPAALRTGATAAVLAVGIFLLNLAPASANYRAKALEATDFIQKTLYDPEAGLYRPQYPINPKALPYDFMWGNGVEYSVLVGATRYEPQTYRPLLDKFTASLERYWDKDAEVPGFDAYFSSKNGDDKYYDDNVWLVLGFAEAYEVTRDPKFLDWARRTQNFVLSGWDEKLGGGIYWHQQKKTSKNTCINGPAAAAAVELYEISHDPKDLEWAVKLYNWTNANLQDKDGLYWDGINLEGKVNDMKWTYNTALMIRTNVGLWQATRDGKYLKEARRVSDAALIKWVNPTTGALGDSARFNHLLCEALLHTYEATRDIKYLNAVRRHADFGYRYVRDVETGGYYDKWRDQNHPLDERKTLIENASAARILWELAPYADVEELRKSGDDALRKGDTKTALNFYQQALDSTAGAQATGPVSKPAPKVEGPAG
jgi:uncharacterized protein YyaL (SSP411 family)